MAKVGQVDEAAQAIDAHLDAFLDHLVNYLALRQAGNVQAIHIERSMAKRALRSVIELQQEPRY